MIQLGVVHYSIIASMYEKAKNACPYIGHRKLAKARSNDEEEKIPEYVYSYLYLAFSSYRIELDIAKPSFSFFYACALRVTGTARLITSQIDANDLASFSIPQIKETAVTHTVLATQWYCQSSYGIYEH